MQQISIIICKSQINVFLIEANILLMIKLGNFLYRNLFIKNTYKKITHKFYYGQGGYLDILLTKRKYQISMETVWEDHSNLTIQGLTGIKNYIIQENDGKAKISDQNLDQKLNETIYINLTIPEDFTLNGQINGNLQQRKSALTTNKLRSQTLYLQMLGQNSILSLNHVQAIKTKINSFGTVKINKLTAQSITIDCSHYYSDKTMVSKQFTLRAKTNSILKSLINPGTAQVNIETKDFEAQSISGIASIKADILDIKRIYGDNSTKYFEAEAKTIKNFRVENGKANLLIKAPQFKNSNALLGKMHKGKVNMKQSSNGVICTIQ